jgi:hypothetical protein
MIGRPEKEDRNLKQELRSRKSVEDGRIGHSQEETRLAHVVGLAEVGGIKQT